jgi:pentapeptide repeat protein
MQGADLQGANLTDAKFIADKDKTYLRLANLQKARLRRADLRNTNLEGAKFQEAALNGANFIGSDLSRAEFRGAYVDGIILEKTPLWREQFGEDALIGEELQAKEPSGDRAYRYRRAKQGYLALKQNFDDLGDYDAVNWAYRKERRMRKCEAFYGKKCSKFAHALVGYVTPDRAEDQSSKRHHLLNGDHLCPFVAAIRASVSVVRVLRAIQRSTSFHASDSPPPRRMRVRISRCSRSARSESPRASAARI